jgi:hypothetical protein
LGVTATAAAVLLVFSRPPELLPPSGERARIVAVSGVGTLEIDDRTVLRVPTDFAQRPDERAVYLLAGTARAQIEPQEPSRPFVVVTPQLRVVVVGTLFKVSVSNQVTEVEVQQGRVRVESSVGKSVTLGPGEWLLSSDPRLGLGRTSTPALPLVPAPVPGPAAAATDRECSRMPTLADRRACLEQQAEGEGLSAQISLYALGLLARDQERDGNRAMQAWREYERRFPDGPLAPEVSVNLVREFLSRRRYSDALAQTETYLGRFPGDQRGPELSLVRAKLLCSQFGQLLPALKAFEDAIATGPRSAVREEALFSKGACLETLAGREEALVSWRLYLRDYPHGGHAKEVREYLSR